MWDKLAWYVLIGLVVVAYLGLAVFFFTTFAAFKAGMASLMAETTSHGDGVSGVLNLIALIADAVALVFLIRTAWMLRWMR